MLEKHSPDSPDKWTVEPWAGSSAPKLGYSPDKWTVEPWAGSSAPKPGYSPDKWTVEPSAWSSAPKSGHRRFAKSSGRRSAAGDRGPAQQPSRPVALTHLPRHTTATTGDWDETPAMGFLLNWAPADDHIAGQQEFCDSVPGGLPATSQE